MRPTDTQVPRKHILIKENEERISTFGWDEAISVRYIFLTAITKKGDKIYESMFLRTLHNKQCMTDGGGGGGDLNPPPPPPPNLTQRALEICRKVPSSLGLRIDRHIQN